MNSLVATPLVVPMLLGIKWLDPEWLQHEYGNTFIWIALAIVFVECGLFFPFLPGDTLLFALGLFIAGSNTTGYSVVGISNEPTELVIAMALVCRPALLIADEPTTALDVTIQAQILDLLQKLQEEHHMSMQFITHDLGVISELADRVIVMYAGTVVEDAPADELFASPRHPYTRLLVESLPGIEVKQALTGIPGLPPPLVDLPPGCSSNPRCPFAFERCRTETPLLQDVAPAQQAACHLYPEHQVLPPLPATVRTHNGEARP